MQIGRKDVLWNYAATFLKIAGSAILLPFILRMLPQETIAIWTIFTTIVAFVGLLDFGFNPSFTRNVSYVYSGVKVLKTTGYHAVEDNPMVDYGLLKGLIRAMQWFYSRAALVLFMLLISIGTFYVHTLLQAYTGSHSEVYISWAILCIINSYYLYTFYYDSLLQGKGLIKRSKQITIIGQLAYLIVAIVLILLRFGLVAIVSAQALSILIIRILSYRSFYTTELRDRLQSVKSQSPKKIFQAIYPNAIKIGLTSLGSLLVNRSAIIIGSLYLSLSTIASYGITIQIIGVIMAISAVYISTYQPQIVQYRVQDNISDIKKIYIKSNLFLFFTFVFGGLGLVLFGDWALNFIGSQTLLLSKTLIVVALLISFLEMNHGLAGNILMTKNEVPFFKAALLSGGFTFLLLIVFFRYTNIGVVGMILAPGIAQGCYQNWKWPMEVMKELDVKAIDIWESSHDNLIRIKRNKR